MKTLCPICSNVLLRHLCQKRIMWFCLGCHQEMPNFDLVAFYAVQNKFRQLNNDVNLFEDNNVKNQINKSYQTTEYDSKVIDLFVNQDKRRLEVVGFILSQINVILVNTFKETKKSSLNKIHQSSLLDISKNKTSILEKAYFLRNSEFILLHICQAILIADSSHLNNKNLSKFGTKSINFKYSIEQSCFIDLIKTSVIDFIRSVSVDSSQNICYFTSEVANYFEIVIRSIIELQQSQESN